MEFVEAFNARDYRRAQRICEGNPAIDSYPLEFACAFLWLMGRPELDDIQSLAAKAMDCWNNAAPASLQIPRRRDLYTTAWLFETAMTLRDQDFEAVGIEKMRSLEGVWLAEQFLRQIPDGDPLYLTARIEIARLKVGVVRTATMKFHTGPTRSSSICRSSFRTTNTWRCI